MRPAAVFLVMALSACEPDVRTTDPVEETVQTRVVHDTTHVVVAETLRTVMLDTVTTVSADTQHTVVFDTVRTVQVVAVSSDRDESPPFDLQAAARDIQRGQLSQAALAFLREGVPHFHTVETTHMDSTQKQVLSLLFHVPSDNITHMRWGPSTAPQENGSSWVTIWSAAGGTPKVAKVRLDSNRVVLR